MGKRPYEIAAAVAAAGFLGVLVSSGFLIIGVALLLLAAALFILSKPRLALWGFLILLPFFMYPATIGGLSLFVGLPAALALSVVLLAATGGRLRGSIKLPAISFSVLLIAATASALFSSDPPHALSRVIYLASFGILAGSVAYARSAEVIRDRDVLAPLLLGATLAGIVLIIQFIIQFAVGTAAVENQLLSWYPLFGGASSVSRGDNWIVPSFNLVRAVFPFMTAPSAGQYMMVGFVTAILALHSGIGNLTRRWLYCSGLILACALAVTLSRQSWVGALVALAVVFIQVRPARLIIGIGVVGAVAFLIPLPGTSESLGQYLLLSTDVQSESSASRIVIWSIALHHIEHDSIVGLGPGLYETLAEGTRTVYYAHNAVLDAFVELGYLGGAAFVVFVGRLLVIMWERSRGLVFIVLISVVVANMFDDAVYLPRNGFLIAVLIGMAGAASTADGAPRLESKAAEGLEDGDTRALRRTVGVPD